MALRGWSRWRATPPPQWYMQTISNYAEKLNAVISSLDDKAVYKQALAQVTAAVEAKRS